MTELRRIHGLYNDTQSATPRIDASTHAFETIEYPHHEIHAGSHYYVQGYLTLADTETYYIKMETTNSTKWTHFIFDIKSTGILTTTLKEDCIGGMTGGTSMPLLNNNRNSANPSTAILTSGVTDCTSSGQLLESDKWGAEGFKENIGGGGSREDEWVLKQNSTYLRMFSSSAADNIVQFKGTWYEHTDKN